LVLFFVGKYKDEMLCDIVSMYAIHLLLGRPWQFDRKSKQNRFNNMYSLKRDNKTLTLILLSPKQVYEDQLKLKGENKIEENDQPYDDVIKSKNKVSQERRRLVSAKIRISKDLDERGEKKERERKK
jgi:hypothetical protein